MTAATCCTTTANCFASTDILVCSGRSGSETERRGRGGSPHCRFENHAICDPFALMSASWCRVRCSMSHCGSFDAAAPDFSSANPLTPLTGPSGRSPRSVAGSGGNGNRTRMRQTGPRAVCVGLVARLGMLVSHLPWAPVSVPLVLRAESYKSSKRNEKDGRETWRGMRASGEHGYATRTTCWSDAKLPP